MRTRGTNLNPRRYCNGLARCFGCFLDWSTNSGKRTVALIVFIPETHIQSLMMSLALCISWDGFGSCSNCELLSCGNSSSSYSSSWVKSMDTVVSESVKGDCGDQVRIVSLKNAKVSNLGLVITIFWSSLKCRTVHSCWSAWKSVFQFLISSFMCCVIGKPLANWRSVCAFHHVMEVTVPS